ncbi:acyltransferase [Salmonella enterica subsp. enterica serovar Tucson]|nr:acyltransferase [Salmonella enterica subsp. enterica serovar Tucson]ELE3277950.1 acyltransferase [Salmonella enterica subsp. enterica serovar Tucson]
MEHLNTSQNKKLEGVQCLRAFAVMIVVFSHFSIIINDLAGISGPINILTQNSPFAVDLFFFISGFIMVYTTKGNISSRVVRFSDFAIKRILRIFPVYYVCFIAFVVFVVIYDNHNSIWNINFNNIIKSFLLIPLNPYDKPPFYGYSLIVPAWTITYEVYFYIIFSITLLITSKYRTIVCSLILLVISVLLQIKFNGTLTIDAQNAFITNGDHLSTFIFASNPIILDFIIGMFIAEFFNAQYHEKIDSAMNILAPALLCFGLASFVSMFRYGYGITHGAIGALFLFISILYYDFSSKISYPKALIYIGNISYSLYISHVVTINIADRYSNALFVYTQSSGWRRYFVVIAISITVAVIMHKLIENPSTAIARKLINKIKESSLKTTN